MAWIELHQAVWTHRKTFLLAAELDLSETYAVAHLIRLWTWALDNAPTGDLSGVPSRVIALGADWKGDEERFISALVASGWLNKRGKKVEIHDWEDYAGKLIDRRTANRDRMRNVRSKERPSIREVQGNSSARAQHVQRTDGAQPSHVHDTVHARAELPDLTGPNTTGPNRTGPNTTGPAALAAGFSGSASDDEIVDALVGAFTDRGFREPPLSAKKERNAVLNLIRTGYTTVQLVDCWTDYREGHYGNDFDRAHLSFEYLAGMNRLVNWAEWRERGKPSQNGSTHKRHGPISHAEALLDEDRFQDPFLQAQTQKFLEGSHAPAAAE